MRATRAQASLLVSSIANYAIRICFISRQTLCPRYLFPNIGSIFFLLWPARVPRLHDASRHKQSLTQSPAVFPALHSVCSPCLCLLCALPYLPSADVVFVLELKPHARFTRDGDDLIFTSKVTLSQVYTLCHIEAPCTIS